MRVRKFQLLLLAVFAFGFREWKCAAEEHSAPLTTALSRTLLSGFVDTSVTWTPPTNHFSGNWLGIMQVPHTNQRVEIVASVDGEGNFAVQGMSFDRTQISQVVEGKLDEKGGATTGGIKIRFNRKGTAILAGRTGVGEIFVVRLLRERS